MTENIWFLFLAGAVGALIKDILQDNKIKLPTLENGELCLGFLGSLVVGGFVGYMVDGSYITAAISGYTGFSIIKDLMNGKIIEAKVSGESIEDRIKSKAKKMGVDPELAVRVAKAESGLKPNATNTNKDDSIDRGLYQINSKWHPEVSENQAFDIDFSINFFCQAVKNGNISWWNATKPVWDIDKKY
jgi:hypothetical protein